MIVDLVYTAEFGHGDGSDECEWSIELTPEEEEIYLAAQEAEEDLDEALPDVLARALEEIKAQEWENYQELYDTEEDDDPDDYFSLSVHFA